MKMLTIGRPMIIHGHYLILESADANEFAIILQNFDYSNKLGQHRVRIIEIKKKYVFGIQ